MGKSKAPDTSGQQEAARVSAQIGQEQWDWFKQEYERTAPEREEVNRRANAASDLQMQEAQLNQQISRSNWEFQQNTFRPIEQGLATDAQNYDTPERRAAAAQAAGAGVEQQISAQRDATSRALARSGVDPSSGKTAALMGSQAIAAAKAKAGASNAAEKQVEQQGWARRLDAASLGRGIGSAQATASSIASQQGSAAASTGAMPLQTTQAGASLMSTGASGGIQGQQVAGNLYGSAAQLQANANNANGGNLTAGLGSIAMAGAYAF